MNKKVRLLVVLGFLVSFFAVGFQSVDASFQPNSFYQLINVNSGKYLEVESASTTNGANVQQWENTNCLCQQWQIVQNSEGYVQLINRHSGKALDVFEHSTADGANIVQWDQSGYPNQQWSLQQVGNAYKLVSRLSGKALEVYNHSTANGANVVQWQDYSNPNQLWTIVEVGSTQSPNFNTVLGYASMNGGTTGGQGGRVEYASTGAQIQQLINDRSRSSNPDEPLTIYVTDTITLQNSPSDAIEVKNHRGQAVEIRNLSIIGQGTNGEFNGIGLRLINAQNVIVRNLSIHHVLASSGEGTAIEVTQGSKNIWIDHNEFYSQLQGNNNSDLYDGLVDIKRNSEFVTVSWNKFQNHWKTMLVGHTDTASLAPDKITYHHNYFHNLNSRVPLIRFADVHMVNNYFKDIQDTAINSRMGARVFVQNNYFDNVGSGQNDPTTGQIKTAVGWFYGSPQTGYWNLSGNTFINTPNSHLSSTTNFTPPYSFNAQSANDARQAVEQYSGIGVVN
uniref:Pectate lyase n=1 Tax=Bacillus sp. JAMB750 TaxID=253629 RepID=F7IWR1_9BACI|nr:pectate lyase [Bacillus sp. JAMB750]